MSLIVIDFYTSCSRLYNHVQKALNFGLLYLKNINRILDMSNQLVPLMVGMEVAMQNLHYKYRKMTGYSGNSRSAAG